MRPGLRAHWHAQVSRLDVLRRAAPASQVAGVEEAARRAAAFASGAVEGRYPANRGFVLAVAERAPHWETLVRRLKGDHVLAWFAEQLAAYRPEPAGAGHPLDAAAHAHRGVLEAGGDGVAARAAASGPLLAACGLPLVVWPEDAERYRAAAADPGDFVRWLWEASLDAVLDAVDALVREAWPAAAGVAELYPGESAARADARAFGVAARAEAALAGAGASMVSSRPAPPGFRRPELPPPWPPGVDVFVPVGEPAPHAVLLDGSFGLTTAELEPRVTPAAKERLAGWAAARRP